MEIGFSENSINVSKEDKRDTQRDTRYQFDNKIVKLWIIKE